MTTVTSRRRSMIRQEVETHERSLRVARPAPEAELAAIRTLRESVKVVVLNPDDIAAAIRAGRS